MKLSWEAESTKKPGRYGTIRVPDDGKLTLTHKIDIDGNFLRYGGREAFIRVIEDKTRKFAEDVWDSLELDE